MTREGYERGEQARAGERTSPIHRRTIAATMAVAKTFALLAYAVATILSVVSGAIAQGPQAIIHVVRPGETLASIAERYYGDAARERVIVAENGLNNQGIGITVGMRLVVPWIANHVVRDGETWADLAIRYYGDARRSFMLMEANGATAADRPDPGAELRVAYPMRHVVAQGETVPRLTKLYYGDDGDIRVLRRFNYLRSNRLSRGRVLLVPLADLELSDEGRSMVAEQLGTPVSGGELRRAQEQADARIPELRQMVLDGRYAEAVGLGNRLLGTGQLSANQLVRVQRELGTAYVALDREDLAVAAFRGALERMPDMELDGIRTSPRVLRAFRSAKATLGRGESGGRRGGDSRDGQARPGGDAGPDSPPP